MNDTLTRFLFENAAIRGEIVHLDATWQQVQQHQDYPAPLRRAMGELMAAAALLAATLKLKGSLILQILGTGPVSLLVVECTGDLAMRATAKWQGELPQGGLRELAGDGRCVITLDPKNGQQTYQGIVPLEGDSVAEILQSYMTRSEQLDTRLFLACDSRYATGLLLQKLPREQGRDDDAWQRLGMLAETVKPEELLRLDAVTLLHRLFHEENVRLFENQPVHFFCTCSRDSVANMLRLLGKPEVDDVIAERGEVEVHCDFCNRRYGFDAVDIEQVFAGAIQSPSNATRH
ncbi:MAG: Hsp33 family molecular chaperone HslO [Methylobacterium sp.]|nr:Hsp33 family molecular chaperone HslO [Methylobacterium sp.]